MATHMFITPPQRLPIFISNPSDILSAAKSSILKSEALHANLVSRVSIQQASFMNVLKPLAEDENATVHETRKLIFYRSMSPDPEVRKVSVQAQALFDDLSVKTVTNEGLYKLLMAVQANEKFLSSECSHLLQQMIRARVRIGLSISTDSTRNEFQQIQHRLSFIKTQFQENISRMQQEIWLSCEELDGLDKVFIQKISSLAQGPDINVKIALEDSIIHTILANAHSSQVRKRVYIAKANRCNDNAGLFHEAIVLRHKLAQLLGYSDYATFVLEDRMAKSPGNVHVYLQELLAMLGPFGRQAMDELKKIKKTHCETIGKSFDGKIYPWDEYYYQRLRNKNKEISSSAGDVSEYFPLNDTLPRILAIFGTFFGIKFVQLKHTSDDTLLRCQLMAENVWSDDIMGFAIWDCDEMGGKFLGYLYLDLIERDGKNKTPSSFNIEPGYTREDGTRHYPVVALTSSLQKPTTERPTLMGHVGLILLVHELGHGIHDLLSLTKYARFHGPDGTTVDFGETPSQLLERWCWMPSILKSLSRHYTYLSPTFMNAWKRNNEGAQIPPEIIPDGMIEKLVAGKHFKGALFYLNQLHWCFFDMAVHEPQKHGGIESLSVAALFNSLRKEIYPTDQDESLGDEWDHGYTSFSHAMGEYGAGYYSYVFTNAYAADIFSSKLLNLQSVAEKGYEYRHLVLEKGGSQPEMITLTNFLGRKPQIEPFLRELQLEETAQ